MLTKITKEFWLDLGSLRRIQKYNDGYEIQMDYAHITETHFVTEELGKLILNALDMYYSC